MNQGISEKMNLVVDISDCQISDQAGEVITTYALGSCLGVSIYDTKLKLGGIMHAMLPLSKIDPVKAKTNPFMFTDTGLMTFLTLMFQKGSQRKNMIVKLAGCSNVLDEKKLFNIGERNLTVARKILWKNDLLIKSLDVGGNLTRTMRLHLDTGITTLRINSTVKEL